MIKNPKALMNPSLSKKEGMDIIIVTSSCQKHQAFLKTRLTELKGTLINSKTLIFSILEDWPKGAGNGLGTLYAFVKAREMGKAEFGIDILELAEASIALYHTAGNGMRMFPITATELGCKPLIKLPGIVDENSSHQLISLIEAVIKQTSFYAPSGKGRLNVFWSDQLFISHLPQPKASKAHIEIFAKFIPFPNETDWLNRGYSSYGMLYHTPANHLFLIEKVDYQMYVNILKSGNSSLTNPLGLSLGCFRVSFPMLKGLIDLFQTELMEKKAKLNTDIHFWMPMMLERELFIDLMIRKNYSCDFAIEHYSRMQTFKKKFLETNSDNLFNAIDIGSDSYWWDFGIISKYYDNNMLLINNSMEGKALKQIFGWDKPINQVPNALLHIDKNSLLYNCHIKEGKIKDSILMNVTAEKVDISNSLIINSNFQSLKAENNLIYSCKENSPCELQKDFIKTDVHFPELNQYYKFITSINLDTQKEWDKCLPFNSISFSKLSQLMHSVLH